MPSAFLTGLPNSSNTFKGSPAGSFTGTFNPIDSAAAFASSSLRVAAACAAAAAASTRAASADRPPAALVPSAQHVALPWPAGE